jgi:hypothetical protein
MVVNFSTDNNKGCQETMHRQNAAMIRQAGGHFANTKGRYDTWFEVGDPARER